MRQSKAVQSAPTRIIRIGAQYRDVARDVFVIAEDQEIRDGQRTGRILVCEGDGTERIPRRWYCREAELKDAEDVLLPIPPCDRGVIP